LSNRVPAGVTFAVVTVDSDSADCTVRNGARRYDVAPNTTFTTRLSLPPGRHDLAVSFCAAEPKTGSRPIGTYTATDIWVLSASATYASDPRAPERARSTKLKAAAARFSGYSAVWFHDLRTGRTAEWNSAARFPAASTVKLGVLVAALRALGSRPERSRFAYDLDAMLRWSSNLATNRLLRRIGNGSTEAGARTADRVLKQLGARSSTFTGEYRVGTSAARSQAEPPFVSYRVTTARDLGRLLFQIHAGAMGRKAALAPLRLDGRRAQLALGLLLSSSPVGDNVGLVRGSVPPTVPIAQKHGWLRDARHSAAIVYQSTGPELVVVLTYRPGLTLGAASAFSGDLLEIVLSRPRGS
jgi:beta-lactamase class A